MSRRDTAVKAATADLFADIPPVSAPAFAPVPVPAPELAPTPRQLVPTHGHPLWYAAVFPEMLEPRASVMLQRLSLSAWKFTPLVSIEMPNALLLEIKGSVNLFGSLETLRADIDASWSRFGLTALTATAPTTLAALWLARAGKRVCIEDVGSLAGMLAELPIACTAWHSDRLQTLRSLGVNRIGELLRLPRAGVARRLGPSAISDLDIALAKQAAPRRAFQARVRFCERCDFETEVETVVYLQKAIEPLIENCARFLRVRQAGVQALELKLRHRSAPQSRVRVGLASITGERRRLADVLDEKLHRLELPAPVRGMQLLSGYLQPLSANSLDAFAGLRGGGRDTAPQLVERLRARLGDEAVYGVASIEEHRPEAAWHKVLELSLNSELHAADFRVTELQANERGLPRPVWLLAEPVLFSAADLRQLRQGDLILEEGPERIESGWWDGKGVARDYYIARRLYGARWWIFQERQTKQWYLHGVFA